MSFRPSGDPLSREPQTVQVTRDDQEQSVYIAYDAAGKYVREIKLNQDEYREIRQIISELQGTYGANYGSIDLLRMRVQLKDGTQIPLNEEEQKLREIFAKVVSREQQLSQIELPEFNSHARGNIKQKTYVLEPPSSRIAALRTISAKEFLKKFAPQITDDEKIYQMWWIEQYLNHSAGLLKARENEHVMHWIKELTERCDRFAIYSALVFHDPAHVASGYADPKGVEYIQSCIQRLASLVEKEPGPRKGIGSFFQRDPSITPEEFSYVQQTCLLMTKDSHSYRTVSGCLGIECDLNERLEWPLMNMALNPSSDSFLQHPYVQQFEAASRIHQAVQAQIPPQSANQHQALLEP